MAFAAEPHKRDMKYHDDDDNKEGQETALTRELDVFDLTIIGVGGIVGAGIFVLSGQAAAMYAGPAVVLSFAIAGGCCTIYALCFAELSTMVTDTGSAYTYARLAFGNFVGWIVGWSLVAEYLFCVSAVSVGWSGYASECFQQLGVPLSPRWSTPPLAFDENHNIYFTGAVLNGPAVFLVVLASIIVGLGVRMSAIIAKISVLIKLAVIATFLACGMFFIHGENYSPFVPENKEGDFKDFGHFGWSGVLRGSSIVFFSYVGFDAITTAASEAKDPSNDLPKSIFLSLGISTALYMLVLLPHA